jgi:uncharacterized membrane protein YesL
MKNRTANWMVASLMGVMALGAGPALAQMSAMVSVS